MNTTLFSFYKSLLAALLLFVSFAGWGQITSLELGTTSFTNNTTGSATFTSKDININAFPNLSLTTLQQTQAGGTGYVSSKNWQGTSISTTKYWEFTVTANSGYQISVSGIVWKGTRSGTGPTSFAIRSSVDNYASNLGTLATTLADLTFSNLGITNKTSITFRVYGWGASAATGTWRCGDGFANSLDISVIGSVNAICTAPSQSFAKDPIDKNIGDPKFTNAFNTESLGAVSYTSSDTSVATIDTSTGEVTIGSTTGSTIITASQAAGGGYCAATKTYTINVHPQVLTNIKGGGVNIVGQFQNPAYQQPINCDANDKRVLQYRKVSTTTSNPDDGRGQWATTLQAVSNPSTNLYLGEVYAGNYDPNNYNDGFLFTNGGGCGNTGTYDNKWNFSGNGQCGLDDVNIANYVTSGGANMGINISNSGFYTFVLKDNTGSTNGYYVGYTSNAPVNISSTEQSILCPNSATITATLSATPSPQEKFYLRYNTTNDFGGTAYTSQVLGTVSSTTVTFNVSSLSAATNYYYYILSTTVSGYDSYSEVDKSLSCLKYLDNNGNNYTLSTPAAINITNQPVGNSYCQNATPTALSVTATGASLTYQWYKNDTNSNTGGTLISGATGFTLAGANISTATAGTTYYYCTISTGSCTTPTATNAVAIIVNATPAITGTTSVCVGKTIQLTGSGTAASTTPWSTNNSVVATVDNAGLMTGVAAGTATITYKNSNGCSVSTTVIVNGNTAITTPPVNQTVTAGNTATFSVVATGSNLSYQWQVSTDCGITWSNIGTNSSSYTTPATDSSFDQNKYQVIVSGSCGSDVTSNIVTLSVNVSSNCLTDNFTTAEGWTSTLGVTYTGTGSSTGIPLTVTVPSGTWVLFNNSLNTSNNYLQLNSVGAYTQLPNLSKPNKITVTARTSGINGSGDLTLQYKNSSDVWKDIETKDWSGTTEVSYDFIINSTISDVATQFRIYIPKPQSSTYVAKVLVSCNVLPTTPTDYTWTGNGGDTSWTTACNWSPKGVPTAIDNVTFNTSPTYLLNLTDSRTVNNLTLTDTGNFNASNTGILTINGTATYDGTANATLDCLSTVKYASSAAQTIMPLNYGILDLTGGDRTFTPNAITGICKSVIPGAGTITATNSTINYNGNNDQLITNKISYYNIVFSGSGTKTPNNAIAVDNAGSVKITGDATADFSNFNLASTSLNSTSFTMDGGRLILGTTETQPNMRGAYSLTGGIVEFKGSNTTAQTIRPATYNNVEITGSNVTNSNGNIILQPNGSFVVKNNGVFTINDDSITSSTGNNATVTVESGGLFRTGDKDGFSGGTGTTATSVNSIIKNVILLPGSTVEYSRGDGDDQVITTQTNVGLGPDGNYSNLKISGTGIKAPVNNLTVNNITDVVAGVLRINETADDAMPNVFTAKKGVQVEGTGNLIVENNANLMQDEDAANSGNITAQRIAKLKFESIQTRADYNYWSSPVAGQKLLYNNTTPGTSFSPGTPNNRIFQYRESDDRFVATADAQFVAGKGYAIRAENAQNGTAYSADGTPKIFEFKGTPNNGPVSTPHLNWSNASHGYNLIGNPYPSNIDFDLLWNANPDKIYSTAYFWTNNQYTMDQQGSTYSGNNYAIYNGTGGNPAAYQEASGSAVTPTASVKPGQGFIVQTKKSGALSFNNGMRIPDKGSFFNNKLPKNRFWLTLTSPAQVVNTVLIGYVPGASDDFEKDFDTPLLVEGSDAFYSVLAGQKLAIQGKSEAFENSGKVPLGTKHFSDGLYTIALEEAEGIFEGGQDIYLLDKLNQSYTKLQDGEYRYSGTSGETANRFEIVFKPGSVLATDEEIKDHLVVYRNGNDFIVKSKHSRIDEVEVYDVSGRLIIKVRGGSDELRINASSYISGTYVLKIKSDEKTVTKKILK